MSELSLLPSERRELKEKIKQLKAEKEQMYAAALRKFNSIIVRSDILTTEQKTALLADLWSKEK